MHWRRRDCDELDALNDYTDLVLEHFAQPRNVGQWPEGTDVVRGGAGSIAEGARFFFSARVTSDSILALRFQAYGCPHCIAAASWLTEQLAGQSRLAVRQWCWRQAAVALAVPTEKYGRLLILEDAVRALVTEWERWR